MNTYAEFVTRYPSYDRTHDIDELRQREYGRLDEQGHIYLDYTGGSLYADSQIKAHADLLAFLRIGPHTVLRLIVLQAWFEARHVQLELRRHRQEFIFIERALVLARLSAEQQVVIRPELALGGRALGSLGRPNRFLAQDRHVLVDELHLAGVHVLLEQGRLHEPVKLPTVRSLEVAKLDDRHRRIFGADLVGRSRHKRCLHYHRRARGAAFGG